MKQECKWKAFESVENQFLLIFSVLCHVYVIQHGFIQLVLLVWCIPNTRPVIGFCWDDPNWSNIGCWSKYGDKGAVMPSGNSRTLNRLQEYQRAVKGLKRFDASVESLLWSSLWCNSGFGFTVCLLLCLSIARKSDERLATKVNSIGSRCGTIGTVGNLVAESSVL